VTEKRGALYVESTSPASCLIGTRESGKLESTKHIMDLLLKDLTIDKVRNSFQYKNYILVHSSLITKNLYMSLHVVFLSGNKSLWYSNCVHLSFVQA
jgi:hypothetical protein